MDPPAETGALRSDALYPMHGDGQCISAALQGPGGRGFDSFEHGNVLMRLCERSTQGSSEKTDIEDAQSAMLISLLACTPPSAE